MLLVLLLLHLLLLLLLQLLLLLLLLRLFGRLLLTLFNVSLVLRRLLLLLLEALGLFGPLLRFLRALLTGLFELVLEIRLLAVVRGLVRRTLRRGLTARTLRRVERMLLLLLLVRLLVCGALRRFCSALLRIDRVLLLLLFVRLDVARLVGRTLRRFGLILRAPQRGLLVAIARAFGADLAVELKLFAANIGLHGAHLVARIAEAMIHEEAAIAVVLRNAKTIVVFRAAPVEHMLTRVEPGLRARGVAGNGSRCGVVLRRSSGRLRTLRRRIRCCPFVGGHRGRADRRTQRNRSDSDRACGERRSAGHGEAPAQACAQNARDRGQTGEQARDSQRLGEASGHGRNSNTPRVEPSGIYGKIPRSTAAPAGP